MTVGFVAADAIDCSSYRIITDDSDGTAIRSRCHAYSFVIDNEHDFVTASISVQDGSLEANLQLPKVYQRGLPVPIGSCSKGGHLDMHRCRPALKNGVYTLVWAGWDSISNRSIACLGADSHRQCSTVRIYIELQSAAHGAQEH